VNKSKIFHDAISPDQINQILNFYSDKEDTKTEIGIVNKNLEYHRPIDFSYKLLNSIITLLTGPDHQFDGGAFKESINPYPPHVDTAAAHYSTGAMALSSTEKKYDLSILIPLVESPHFKTIAFDIFSEINDFDLTPYIRERNSLEEDEFTHLKSFHPYSHLPIDKIFNWKLGDIFVWPRNQLHTSSNFAKHGLVKKFLVMFIK
jgi:hypothetical protein